MGADRIQSNESSPAPGEQSGATAEESTDAPRRRHRYVCEACELTGPGRKVRGQATRDAQQHDVAYHDGDLTCGVVTEEIAR